MSLPLPIQNALNRVHNKIQNKGGIHVLHSSEISRSDRVILTQTRWLEEILQGWYMVVRPDLPPGESTSWYANFWDFIEIYLEHHYGKEYCFSAEYSLDLHLGKFAVPKQITVIAKKGSGKPIGLPYETSLLVYSDPSRLPVEQHTIRGIQVMPFAYALCRVSPTYFLLHPREAEIALQSINDSSDLIRTIIQNNFKTAAGRLIGAYRFLNNEQMATQIKNSLLSVGILVTEENPFKHEIALIQGEGFKSPYVARIHSMWAEFRPFVIAHFPSSTGLSNNSEKYLAKVSELYSQDAYNSLSIEGYKVTQELLNRVKNNDWNPDFNKEDRQQRDALAARGYYEAFQEVKNSINQIFEGQVPGLVFQQDLAGWYQKLFAPSARLGIISPTDLFGYRRHQVYIRNSRHTPPPKEHLLELMNALFECLKNEKHPAVRAVLGHFIFVYIHPYMDGNGRLGRFLMNLMFASGGYPWTIIHVEHRNEYISSLESASVDGDIIPFTKFVLSEMKGAY